MSKFLEFEQQDGSSVLVNTELVTNMSSSKNGGAELTMTNLGIVSVRNPLQEVMEAFNKAAATALNWSNVKNTIEQLVNEKVSVPKVAITSTETVVDPVVKKQKKYTNGHNVRKFMDECCERSVGAKTKFRVIFGKYKGWCVENGIRNHLDYADFGRAMQNSGVVKTRSPLGTTFHDISLKGNVLAPRKAVTVNDLYDGGKFHHVVRAGHVEKQFTANQRIVLRTILSNPFKYNALELVDCCGVKLGEVLDGINKLKARLKVNARFLENDGKLAVTYKAREWHSRK
jgi:hypothetical protein